MESLTPRALEWIWRDSPPHPNAWRIFVWWETRRIAYNLFLFSLGVPSLLLFFIFISASGQLRPGEDAVEPLALIAAPFLANACYCAGWVVEICLRSISLPTNRVGPGLLAAGLWFSAIVVALPSVTWFIAWLVG